MNTKKNTTWLTLISMLATVPTVALHADYDDEYTDTIDEAIDRLEEGWDEAYLSVEGTPMEMLDDDEYRFVVGGSEVILELSEDEVVLPLGETIRVTGELEYADEDDTLEYGIQYEFDAETMRDLNGNVITEDDDYPYDDEDELYDDADDETLEEVYGNRAKGTLAELIAILESSQDDDLNVHTVGILGEAVEAISDEDDDYLFFDESGVIVVLDLDSRADLSFALTTGMELEIIGELERIDEDYAVPASVMYELDAVCIRLADGTTLDIGQRTMLAGATISDWIGYFWKLDDEGWFYHPSKGFIYTDDTLDEDDWFLSLNRDEWIYVNRDFYPYIYSSTEGWHYLIGSSYGEMQHAYDFDEDEWVLDYWQTNP